MAVLAILFYGCNSDSATGANPDESGLHHHPGSRVAAGHDAHSNSDLGHLSFVSGRDTSCGMPLSAGVSDTLLYGGEVFGFCSPACKQQFAALLPEASVQAANEKSYKSGNQ